MEVWEKRSASVSREHEVRVFPRNFEFFPNFHKCFYNSIGTRKKCFLFPLLNSLLKTIKKINLLISIAKYCLYFIFLNSRAIHATRAKVPVFLSCYRNTGFLSFRPINARVFKRLFYKYIYSIDFLIYSEFHANAIFKRLSYQLTVCLIRVLLADATFLRLKFHALNLFRWQHFENNSFRLFNRFSDLDFIICSFSSVQRLQLFAPGQARWFVS